MNFLQQGKIGEVLILVGPRFAALIHSKDILNSALRRDAVRWRYFHEQIEDSFGIGISHFEISGEPLYCLGPMTQGIEVTLKETPKHLFEKRSPTLERRFIDN